jgi:hypothetical protein
MYRTVEKRDEDGNSYSDEQAYHVPLGQQIGWVNHEEVFLEIEASLAVIQRLTKDSSLRPLPRLPQRPLRELHARGF